MHAMWRELFYRWQRWRSARYLPSYPIERLLLFNPTSSAVPEALPELLSLPAFADCVREANQLVLGEFGWYPLDEEPSSRVQDGQVGSSALSVVRELTYQLALQEAMAACGERFDAVAGISLGELAAACAAGSIRRSVALRLLCRVLPELVRQQGEMAVIPTAYHELPERIRRLPVHLLSTARTYTALTASVDSIAAVTEAAKATGTGLTWLGNNLLVHTPLVDRTSVLHIAEGVVKDAVEPAIPYFSSVAGTLVRQRLDARYWTAMATRRSRVAELADAAIASGVREVVLLGTSNLKAELVAAASASGREPPKFRTAVGILREHIRRRSVSMPSARECDARLEDVLRRDRDWSTAPLVPVSAPPGWVALDHNTVCELLREPARFSSAPFKPYFGILHGADPPDHTRLRRILAPFFGASKAVAFAAPTTAIARATLQALRERSTFDLVADYFAPVVFEVNRLWLGLALEPARRMRSDPFSALGESDVFEGATPDGLLAELRADARLSMEEVVALAPFLLTAGTTTMQDFGGLAVQAWLDDPAQAQRLQAGTEMLDAWIEEQLRLDPPVQYLMRQVTAPTRLGGQSLATGDIVYAALTAANRDPEVFAQPTSRALDRAQQRSLSFGHGPHFCLGHQFARLQARQLLGVLLDVWRDLEASEPGAQPAFKDDSMMRGMAKLPMRWRDPVTEA